MITTPFHSCKHQLKKLMLLLVLGVSLGSISAHADDELHQDLQLKSALVYKLTRFVTWPKQGDNATSPFQFCLEENSAFGPYIQAIVSGLPNQQSMNIMHINAASEDISDCDVVYVGKGSSAAFQTHAKMMHSKHLLSVSDVRGFAKDGGMIEIVRRNNRLGFIINMHTVGQTDLRIAAPLLRMATLIRQEESQ